MVTDLVAISPGGEEFHGSGELVGELATERRGQGGFGYDPIFVPIGDTRTVAEIGRRLEAPELAPRPCGPRACRGNRRGLTYAQRVDAAQALADLTEISSQVAQVAIVDRDGSLLATTVRDPARAERFVGAVLRLLEEADRLARSRGLPELTQLEASTLDGSVFAVRRDGRLIAATTRPDPTVGLVFYDLKHCLGSVEEAAAPAANGAPAPAARRRRKAEADTSA